MLRKYRKGLMAEGAWLEEPWQIAQVNRLLKTILFGKVAT